MRPSAVRHAAPSLNTVLTGEMAELVVNLGACGVSYGLIMNAGATFSAIRFLYVGATAVASVVCVYVSVRIIARGDYFAEDPSQGSQPLLPPASFTIEGTTNKTCSVDSKSRGNGRSAWFRCRDGPPDDGRWWQLGGGASVDSRACVCALSAVGQAQAATSSSKTSSRWGGPTRTKSPMVCTTTSTSATWTRPRATIVSPSGCSPGQLPTSNTAAPQSGTMS